MATPSASDSPQASTKRPPSLRKSRKQQALVSATVDLHPDHVWALDYLQFMTRNQEQPITLSDFVHEAIARHLALVSKTISFPPDMLEKMTRAGLVK